MTAKIKDMLGVTMKMVAGKKGEHELTFTAEDNRVWKFYHSQDCCESVAIEDITGDLSDLVGNPLVQAEDVSGVTKDPESTGEYCDESYTWTFYKFATIRGSVTVRWLGSSNGYYGEDVDFALIAEGDRDDQSSDA